MLVAQAENVIELSTRVTKSCDKPSYFIALAYNFLTLADKSLMYEQDENISRTRLLKLECSYAVIKLCSSFFFMMALCFRLSRDFSAYLTIATCSPCLFASVAKLYAALRSRVQHELLRETLSLQFSIHKSSVNNTEALRPTALATTSVRQSR